MIELLDGRSEFYQWDTGRSIIVKSKCTQVHFRNNLSTPTIDVEVYEKDGIFLADVPDELLQDTKDITVYVYTETATCGYTQEERTFNVVARNKPSGYVFTPTQQITMKEIKDSITKKQDSTDESLDTEDKTIVGAINEVLEIAESTALGEGSYSGHNAYYIEAINTKEKWITLSTSTTKPEYPEIGSNVADPSTVIAPYTGIYEVVSDSDVTITNELGHTVTLESEEKNYFYLIRGKNKLTADNTAVITFNRLEDNGMSYESELTVPSLPLTSSKPDKVYTSASVKVNETITATVDIEEAGIYYIKIQINDNSRNLIRVETDTGFYGNIQQYQYGWNSYEDGDTANDMLMVYLRAGENTFHITNIGTSASYINTFAVSITEDLVEEEPQYADQCSINHCKVTPAYTSSAWSYAAQDQVGYFNGYAGGTKTSDELAPGDYVDIVCENLPYTGVYAFQLFIENITGGDIANVRVITEDGYYSDYELNQIDLWTNRMDPPKDMPLYMHKGDNNIRIINIGTSTVKLDDTDCGRLDLKGVDRSLDFLGMVKNDEPIQYKNINYDTGYEAGDEFSILNGPAYDFCGYISKIDGNKIYYEEDLPFNVLDTSSGKSLDHIFFVPSKPYIGLVTIVDNAFATGIGAIAAGKTSFASGMDTIAGGGHSVVGGRRTYAAYCSTAFGLDTYAKGRYTFTAGRNTRALGEYSTALNMNSIAKGEGAFAHGKGAEADTEAMEAGGKWNATTKGKLLVYGNGLDHNHRSDAYILDWDGNGWYRGGLKLGGDGPDEADDVLVRSQILSLIQQYGGGIRELYHNNYNIITSTGIYKTSGDYIICFNYGNITQYRFDYLGNFYIRYRTSGTWYPWKKFVLQGSTLSDYGITDTYTRTEVENLIDNKINNAITRLIGGSY